MRWHLNVSLTIESEAETPEQAIEDLRRRIETTEGVSWRATLTPRPEAALDMHDRVLLFKLAEELDVPEQMLEFILDDQGLPVYGDSEAMDSRIISTGVAARLREHVRAGAR